MNHYVLDITVTAAFGIEAESEEEARRIAMGFSDCSAIRLDADGDTLEGEASFCESDIDLSLEE